MPVSCPQPVYAPDMPVADLRTAELFVVALLRLWILPGTDPAGIHPDWRQGCVRAGIAAEGVAAFDALFRVVAVAALRTLDVRCLRCARLGGDEAWLLQFLSMVQQRREDDAAGILGNWLPPAAVRLAMAPARQFAMALAAHGLHVPRRHAEAAVVDRLAPFAHAARGLTLVQ